MTTSHLCSYFFITIFDRVVFSLAQLQVTCIIILLFLGTSDVVCIAFLADALYRHGVSLQQTILLFLVYTIQIISLARLHYMYVCGDPYLRVGKVCYVYMYAQRTYWIPVHCACTCMLHLGNFIGLFKCCFECAWWPKRVQKD